MTLSLGFLLFILQVCSASIPDARPAESKRTFVSTKIDALISYLQPLFSTPDLGILFSNCLPNTLDTTVLYAGKFADPLVDELVSCIPKMLVQFQWLKKNRHD